MMRYPNPHLDEMNSPMITPTRQSPMLTLARLRSLGTFAGIRTFVSI